MPSKSGAGPTDPRETGGYARSLIEASLDPLVTISPAGKITDVNEATVRVTGAPREELIGSDFSDYFTDPGKAREGYERVFAEGSVTDYALTIRHRDGRLTDVLYNASLYKDARSRVLGVFAAARDVTAQQQATQYARSLLEASLDPLVTISPAGKITDVNEATVRVTGAPREELIGSDFSDYFTEPGKARDGYERVFAEGSVTDYALTILHRDGRLTDVLYNASLYSGVHGRVLGVFAAARDVTAQKRVERINAARLRLLEFAASHTAEEVLQRMLDEAEQLSGSRIGFCHLLDDNEENFRLALWSTRTRSEFCQVEDARTHAPVPDAGVWADCVAQRRPVIHNEYAAVPHRKGLPQGHAPVTRDLVVPVIRDNRIRAILGVGNKPADYTEQDTDGVALLADLGWEIAERKWAEEYIRQLNEELEQRVLDRTSQLQAANNELEAFSYSVSHDLRAPLRGIDGFSQALLEDYGDILDEQGQDYLRRVRAGTQRMGQLIDDILGLSRLTRAEMRRERVDLSALAESIIEELRKNDPQRAVEVTIEPRLVAAGDAELLRVVLMNLLSNAWKFTANQPHPTIEFGRSDRWGTDSSYFVTDNGAGFDMAYVGKLFGAFQRLHSTSEFPGSGIGLATVQRIIHKHGGQVGAHGVPGHGATFFFTLPENEVAAV